MGEHFQHHLGSSDSDSLDIEELTTAKKQKKVQEHRGSRKRGRSQTYNHSLEKGMVTDLKVVDYQKLQNQITCRVKSRQNTYTVELNSEPSCSCPFYHFKMKNSRQVCKHLIWVYLNIARLSKEDQRMQQTRLTVSELNDVIKRCPSDLPCQTSDEVANVMENHLIEPSKVPCSSDSSISTFSFQELLMGNDFIGESSRNLSVTFTGSDTSPVPSVPTS